MQPNFVLINCIFTGEFPEFIADPQRVKYVMVVDVDPSYVRPSVVCHMVISGILSKTDL